MHILTRLIGTLLLSVTVIGFTLTADAKPSQQTQTECAEYVPNNSFEEDDHWLWFPLDDIGYTEVEALSGKRSMTLHTEGDITSIAATMLSTIPAKPDSVQLSFQYKSKNFNLAESLHITLVNRDQRRLWEVTILDTDPGEWHRLQFDIPTRALVNQELFLGFALIHEDDDSNHSEIYLDDISLQVCPGTLQPIPTPTPDFISPESVPKEFAMISQFVKSTDLADWDGDGDLDQAKGRAGKNQVHAYNKMTASWELVWESPESDYTWDVAWADWDNDGDPDLAVANAGQPNRIYRNEIVDGKRTLVLAWSSVEKDYTLAIAWGDYDGDDDPDLAVGNAGTVNRVYENDDGILKLDPADGLGWQAPPESLQTEVDYVIDSATVNNLTMSVAWGDMEGDGDLDLAVGNLGFNQIYRNDGDGDLINIGTIDPVPTVTSLFPPRASGAIPQATSSVAWGDWDGDGDLDLAAANFTFQTDLLQELEQSGLIEFTGLKHYKNFNLIYENIDNIFQVDPTQKLGWVFEEANESTSVAWADWENIGTLGLAFGNLSFNEVYRTERSICHQDGKLYRRLWRMKQAWRSLDFNLSWDITWGDIDGNGLLDLFFADLFTEQSTLVSHLGQMNFTGLGSIACRNDAIEEYDSHILIEDYPKPFPMGWGEPEDHNSLTYGMAWGDIEGDGDLDVVYGNKHSANRLYLNKDGEFVEDENVWTDDSANDPTYAVQLGDLNGDGALDIVFGNEVGINKLYEYDGGRFQRKAWTEISDETYSLALGDWDGDSDIDIAVGNAGENFVYENDCTANGCIMRLDPENGWGWRSGDDLWTHSLDWGDWDNDGDLDLAVGNLDAPNYIYENVGGTLLFDPAQNRGWRSEDSRDTYSLRWGDWDNDGDLDLAVGNYGDHNQVFENENGTLQLDIANGLGWQSPEQHQTTSVDWGDADGDNDLDLFIVNFGNVDYFYASHEGELVLEPENGLGWRSSHKPLANAGGWIDWDQDGDLDMALANHGSTNGVAENYDQDQALLPDSPPTVSIQIVGDNESTPRAKFQATSVLLQEPVVPITYTLTDPNGEPVSWIRGYFSLDGGGTWQPATPTEDTVLHNLAAPDEGAQHTYYWHADADMIKNNHVTFRIEASQGYSGGGPYQVAYSAAQSFPFQLQAAKVYAKVVDTNNDPVAGAMLMVNGQEVVDDDGRAVQTDSAGLARLNESDVGTSSLMAVLKVHEQPSTREGHDGWAYRTYVTSQTWKDDMPQGAIIAEEGEQRLVISPTNSLVLFNVVISLEWDATQEYMDQIASAMEISGTNYLYDLTDGQMAFGEVKVYDNSNLWFDADIQVLAQNNVRPHATVNGILAPRGSGAIRVGRYWNGSSSTVGPWTDKNGYRTLLHEFGHYALGLFDEYIGYAKDFKGNITRLKKVQCTGVGVKTSDEDGTNASAMYWQYNASEFSDDGTTKLWSEGRNCYDTLQWHYHTMSPWRTIVEHFGDTESPPRWQLQSPSDRGVLMAGPAHFPRDMLDFPTVTISNSGTVETAPIELTVLSEETEQGVPNAVVVLYKKGEQPVTVTQGLTLRYPLGKIEILGAEINDEIRVITLDGALSGSKFIRNTEPMVISLQ